MTYAEIVEYLYQNMDFDQYFSAEELLFDAENLFRRTNSYFPIEARDLIRERFTYNREFAEMEAKQAEQKQIAEYIGSGKIPQSLSDEIVEDFRSPKSEIMDIDMTEYATQRESVVPPDIQKFVQGKESFFTKVFTRFRNIFRR